MTSLPSAFARAIGQLSDPAILRVLAKSIAVTLASIGLLGLGGWYLLAGLIEQWQLSFGAELGALVAIVITIIAGWLLGRELQDMVWLRHAIEDGAKPPISAGTCLTLGGIVAVLLTIPFVNLLAPVIGAAAATHLVHRPKRPQ